MWIWLIGVGVAYLAGSIPFGLLIGRARGVDPRQSGSGNIGASNIGRTLGRAWGGLCFLLDVIKGLAPVLGYGEAAGLLVGEAGAIAALGWLSVAAAAVLGHVFPVWLGFRGGKGVATGLGVVLGLWPVLTLPGLAAGALWFAVCKATGYVSLSSMLAAVILPVLTVASGLAWGRSAGETAVYVAVAALLALLVVVRHRGNLRHLREGTEPKVRWMGKRH